MVKFALLARLEAKPGKEQTVADFLKGALPLAMEEARTISWYALQLGPSTFGIFDTFENEEGRDAHLTGPFLLAHGFLFILCDAVCQFPFLRCMLR
jgi:quinol monooxygenase YgiN